MAKSTRIKRKDHRLSRVVWNTKSWKLPSGSEGKSNNPDNHEHDYGYGYEEWLLDIDKVINGYHYGFLQSINLNFSSYSGKTFPHIYLYTLNAKTGKRYWVAHLRDVKVLTQSECERATEEYQRRGWLDEMRQQMQAVTTQIDFTEHHNQRIVHLRFKPEMATIYDKPVLIDSDHDIYKPHSFDRFMLFYAYEKMDLPK